MPPPPQLTCLVQPHCINSGKTIIELLHGFKKNALTSHYIHPVGSKKISGPSDLNILWLSSDPGLRVHRLTSCLYLYLLAISPLAFPSDGYYHNSLAIPLWVTAHGRPHKSHSVDDQRWRVQGIFILLKLLFFLGNILIYLTSTIKGGVKIIEILCQNRLFHGSE